MVGEGSAQGTAEGSLRLCSSTQLFVPQNFIERCWALVLQRETPEEPEHI